MNATVQQTLKVVRTLLSGHGGAKAALSFLERRTNEHAEVHDSAIIWACLSDLREQTGDKTGAREASERASLLRSAPVRTLSFDEIESITSSSAANKQQHDFTMCTPRSWMQAHTPSSTGFKGTFVQGSSTTAVQEALQKAHDLGKRCEELLGEQVVDKDRENVISRREEYRSKSIKSGLKRSALIGKCTCVLLEHAV